MSTGLFALTDFMNYEIWGLRVPVSLIKEGKRNKHILESRALVGP